MRGYAAIGLHSPQKKENVGAVLRAAYCFGAKQVNIGTRNSDWVRAATNTPSAHRHVPVFVGEDALDPRPYGSQVVAVDLVDEAEELASFKHPNQALYVFGPENGTLGKGILERAQYRVFIPSKACLNLAACVNVVLYDRMVKRSERYAEAA